MVPFALFIVIALLRDGTGGSSSGFTPLVLFPALWLALYDRGVQWIAASVCAGLTLVLPILFVGAPDYTDGDWLRGLFLTTFAAALGFVARRWRTTQREAITDALTGVPNRRLWDEQFPRLVALAKRERKVLLVAMVDLDGFKSFNDTRGHRAGDRLLESAAHAWLVQLRQADLLSRYGGDEFAIALYDCSPEEGSDVLARVRSVTPGGQTCSAGIATLQDDEDWQHLLERADRALYEAKRDRNHTVISPSKPAATPG